MEAEGTEPAPSRANPLPSVLVAIGAVGTGLLWEPLTGVYRRTVELNWAGTSAFALWGIVIVAALAVSVSRRTEPGAPPKFIQINAVLLACLAVVTWGVILATGAVGSPASDTSDGHVELHPNG
jgi:hypothetical protein